MDLAELLSTHREHVLQRWTEKVRGTIHPAGMPRLELVDHLPGFLDEVARSLRLSESPEKSRIAAEHGVQRLGLGFNVDSVVREYGALRASIVEVAAEEKVRIPSEEHEVLTNCVITGIAEAVSEYQRQREAEQHRQAGEHFAFIAHELRNPLGSALTAIALLQRQGRIPPDVRAAQILERSLARMNELIDGSLRLAQIGSGITLHREPVSLRSLLDDAELAAAVHAEEKSIAITLHLERDVTVSVDSRLVRSALSNLVRNAVKFTSEGGTVQVRAQPEEARIVIEVEDRCGGLPPGEVEKSFSPFVQIGSDRSGFGLGLAIARQAADAHGGSLRVQNLPGKGCIFTLELPTVA